MDCVTEKAGVRPAIMKELLHVAVVGDVASAAAGDEQFAGGVGVGFDDGNGGLGATCGGQGRHEARRTGTDDGEIGLQYFRGFLGFFHGRIIAGFAAGAMRR